MSLFFKLLFNASLIFLSVFWAVVLGSWFNYSGLLLSCWPWGSHYVFFTVWNIATLLIDSVHESFICTKILKRTSMSQSPKFLLAFIAAQKQANNAYTFVIIWYNVSVKLLVNFLKYILLLLISSRALDHLLSKIYFSLVTNMYMLLNTDSFVRIWYWQMGRVFLMSPHIFFSFKVSKL